MPSRTSTLLASPAPGLEGSDYLSSSLSGLSRARSTNNLIVKAYKQATQLYLTRRFREAWDVICPVVGTGDGDSSEGGVAPVAQSSRGTRTKVWVFYLSLIHAIVELGAEDGKRQFGTDTWRAIVAKAREGTVWNEIVQSGYAGAEGEVDAEVVVNLATLLLGHMPSQSLNQRCLEGYLAASEDVGQVGWDGTSTPMSTHSASPKALQARLKILELYTLHVLPETGEWDYAKEFIESNDSLDEERKEAFLQALEGLQEEREGNLRREKELQVQREKEQAAEVERRRAEETARLQAEERQRVAEAEARERQQREQQKARQNTVQSSNSALPPKAKPNRQPPRTSPATHTTIYTRLTSQVQSLVKMSRQNIGTSRLLIFFLAFLILAARRDLRLRLRRALDDSWNKVRQTIGMGVKVSYV